LAAYMQPSA